MEQTGPRAADPRFTEEDEVSDAPTNLKTGPVVSVTEAQIDVYANGAAFPRSYDFFKHMTGVALISLGGVFALMQTMSEAGDRRRGIAALAAICLSGAISLTMASALATLEVKPARLEKIAKQIRFGLIASSTLLGFGLGAVIQTFF